MEETLTEMGMEMAQSVLVRATEKADHIRRRMDALAESHLRLQEGRDLLTRFFENDGLENLPPSPPPTQEPDIDPEAPLASPKHARTQPKLGKHGKKSEVHQQVPAGTYTEAKDLVPWLLRALCNLQPVKSFSLVQRGARQVRFGRS